MIPTEMKTIILQRLEPIAPKWTKVLRKQDGTQRLSEPNNTMRIYNLSDCILGEAHGNGCYSVPEDKRFCNTCDILGNYLLAIAYPQDYEQRDPRTGNSKHDQAWLELYRFAKHFTRKHLRIIQDD